MPECDTSSAYKQQQLNVQQQQLAAPPCMQHMHQRQASLAALVASARTLDGEAAALAQAAIGIPDGPCGI